MRQRDRESYHEFIRMRSGPLYRSACLLTGGDTHLAEDLVQETLGRMYSAWSRRTCIENPVGYAQKVLIRAHLTHRRRRSSGERPMDGLPDHGAEGEDTPLRVTLLAALARLTPEDRAVLVLRFWEDLSVERTAEVMGTTPSAVRSRSGRALTRLRAVLGARDITELTA
ncbi:SigE family RNA polymerase sigma factor [Streptomyces alkaliphilus]|uniref:SigE family RNA polymerase sigma factor n=1 Tax=Streptomyces alkaliphilus TaxID=1472722 RepID=UPI00117EDE27|nr:SigE family RNA polymerase sigma factor [Streptomyces alkaliphilus]MQS08476.1 SigE family RNA polymerase sigma factor [Streptomyces alkaliphilus]